MRRGGKGQSKDGDRVRSTLHDGRGRRLLGRQRGATVRQCRQAVRLHRRHAERLLHEERVLFILFGKSKGEIQKRLPEYFTFLAKSHGPHVQLRYWLLQFDGVPEKLTYITWKH